jgi:hypothetical protein
MKKTKRKGFNFLRSYFDVVNELKDDSDKLDFLLSIINKQFLNEDPKELGFVAKLCYESQRHSIESSVKGWIRVAKTDLQGNPVTDPSTNPTTNPKEEEEKEEVEVKVEVKEEVEEKVKEKILSQEMWIDTICMKKRIDKDLVKEFLKNFLDDQGLKENLDRSVKEIKKHFIDWLNKQLEKKKKSSAKKEEPVKHRTI